MMSSSQADGEFFGTLSCIRHSPMGDGQRGDNPTNDLPEKFSSAVRTDCVEHSWMRRYASREAEEKHE